MKTILFEEVKRINELMGLDSNIIVESNIFTELLKRDARQSLYNLGKVLRRPIRSVDEIVEADIPMILRSTSKAADEFKSMIVKAWGISADEFESKTTQELIQDLSTLGVKDGKDIIRIIKKASSDLGVEPKGGLPKPRGGGSVSSNISVNSRIGLTPENVLNTDPDLSEAVSKLSEMLDDAGVQIPKNKKIAFLDEIQKKLAERMETLNKQYSKADIEDFFNDPGYAKTIAALNRLPVDKRREMILSLKESLGKDYKTFISKLNVGADTKKFFYSLYDKFFNNILLGKQFWIQKDNWFKTFLGWYKSYIWRTEKWFLTAMVFNTIATAAEADNKGKWTIEKFLDVAKEATSGAAKSIFALIPIYGPVHAGTSLVSSAVNMAVAGINSIKKTKQNLENPTNHDSLTDVVMNLTVNDAKNFVENQDGLKNNLPKDISEYGQIDYKEITGGDGKTKIQVWLDGINTVTLERRKTPSHPLDGEVKLSTN
jgi:hypothetical protein